MTIRLACHDYNWIPFSRNQAEKWPLERILAEVAEAGYRAVEFSAIPREMDDPTATRRLLDQFGLELVGMTLTYRGEQDTDAILRARADFLADLGADICVFMAGSSKHRQADGPTEAVVSDIAGIASRVVAYACGKGLDTVVHNHLGTVVETCDEIDRFLAQAEGCGLCLDTGHLIARDEDPAEAVRRFRGALRHVHIKDSRFHDDGRFDDFVELGEGNSRFRIADTLDALREIDYGGWMTVELDRTRRTPLESAKRCLSFLESHGISAA